MVENVVPPPPYKNETSEESFTFLECIHKLLRRLLDLGSIFHHYYYYCCYYIIAVVVIIIVI